MPFFQGAGGPTSGAGSGMGSIADMWGDGVVSLNMVAWEAGISLPTCLPVSKYGVVVSIGCQQKDETKLHAKLSLASSVWPFRDFK